MTMRPRRLIRGSLIAGTIGCLAAMSLGFAQPGSAAGLTVAVTTLADSGPGSLRRALQDANAAAAGSTVTFTVAGTIRLASPLPAVTNEVTIDATTAPGYSAAPVVEIDLAGLDGLNFGSGSSGSQLLGASVTNGGGSGVTITSQSVTLDKNYIGLTPTASAAGNAGAGILLAPGSAKNLIGLNESGASGVVANVISGNAGSGIRAQGSSSNIIVANRIGTDPQGESAVPNGKSGIALTDSSSTNTIGGTEFVDTATGNTNDPTGDKGTVTPVFVVPPLGNLVSGNGGNGILISSKSQSNMLNGNFVGTTADGDDALGNGDNGVHIKDANDNTLQGCKFQNNPFVYYNVLSGNGANGLRVTSSNNTLVQANFFGIGADNTSIVANRGNGILVDKGSSDTQVGGVIPLGNVSAGNRENGIEVRGKSGGFTTFNTFGGLLAFKGAAPNGKNGLLVTATGGDIMVRTNVMSGNTKHGIKLAGRANGVTVDPNIVGLNTRGNEVLPNGGNGVVLTGKAHHNTIGGTRRSVIPQNTFSGNDGFGLAITGKAHHNKVFNSYIGTSVSGRDELGNGKAGVVIGGKAKKNKIGYGKSKVSKLISGNDGAGVLLRKKTHKNRVIQNFIGRDKLGGCLPNGGKPVRDKGRNTVKLNLTCS